MTRVLIQAVAAALYAIGCAAAQAGGELGREQRQVTGFSQIVLRGVGDLLIDQGDRESLVIEAEKRLLPKITSEVRRGVLYFDFNEPQIQTQYPIRFLLTVKSLNAIRSEGSGDVSASQLTAERLAITAAGSGSFNIESVVGKNLKVLMAGASDIAIGGGRVTVQEVEIEGSGEYEAPKLASSRASVSISGSGSAVVAARESLRAAISGSGEINYYGNPKVEERISGAGSVERLGAVD